MKQATTLQFRSMVRACALAKGIVIVNSWTNGAGRGTCETGIRWVGLRISMRTAFGSGEKFAEMVEIALNKKGLTAATRYTDAGGKQRFSRGGEYIRGTCDYAV